MTTRYLSTAETAKLIRAELRLAFPGIKFSVKCTRGGSVNVAWTDGPTSKQVDAIVGKFAGSYFDGMTDYKGSVTANLNGERVNFGADFVFTYREVSDELLSRVIERTARKWGVAAGTVAQYNAGELWRIKVGSTELQSLIREAASRHTCTLTQSAPTAARVEIVGRH